MRKIAVATLGLSVYWAAQAQAQDVKAGPPSLTINADIYREVVPDTAILDLAVSSEKKTASEAAEETARNSKSVLDFLKADGTPARDVRTLVSVSPEFDDTYDAKGIRTSHNLRGYLARNEITIRLRDTARAGTLARALIDKGANIFSGIHFEVSDDEHRIDELRISATKDALHRAELYAKAAGVKLGRILSIEPGSERERSNAADLPSRRSPPTSPEGTTTTVIPVEPGVVVLSSGIGITWEIFPLDAAK